MNGTHRREDSMQLTDNQSMELARLKQYFPYRIVWGAIHPSTGEWFASANTTKRQMNGYVKNGWVVFQAT
jgi:hypothetical protein